MDVDGSAIDDKFERRRTKEAASILANCVEVWQLPYFSAFLGMISELVWTT